jgi:hypothetical protein
MRVPQEEPATSGAHPYYYFVPYQPDIDAALQGLRQREFRAGRYHPVMPFVFEHLPPGPTSAAPGRQHGSIDEARWAADAEGTRSILDLDRVGQTPDVGVAARLPDERLRQLYGTDRPTRAMLEHNMDFLEDVACGQGVYVVLYEGERPSEIFFAGYSFDRQGDEDVSLTAGLDWRWRRAS